MKKGAYVTFVYNKRRYKGRISVQDRNYYLCQSVFNATNCDEQYGNEFAYYMGRLENAGNIIKHFKITVVTKKEWDAFREPLVKKVFGHTVHFYSDQVSFGCGAVVLRKSEIREFISNFDKYKRIAKKRDELRKEVIIEEAKVSTWLLNFPGIRAVIGAIHGRNLISRNVNVEKLKRIFSK